VNVAGGNAKKIGKKQSKPIECTGESERQKGGKVGELLERATRP